MDRNRDAGQAAWVDPDDAPELTDEWFARADVYDGNRLVRPGEPDLEAGEAIVSLRFDADVLAALNATGPAWQTRINDILRQALKRSS